MFSNGGSTPKRSNEWKAMSNEKKKLGLSLGSVNYVLSNRIDAGLIRAKRFKNSKLLLREVTIYERKHINHKIF